MSEYIIYRLKPSKKITSYSILKKIPDGGIESAIDKYNSSHDRIAEIVKSDDIKSLIEIAEANKLLKEQDIKSIEYAFDNLQSEIYSLKDRMTL